MKRTFSIAAVVPRWGASLGGGAETLMRELFLALKDPLKNPELLDVQRLEVFTTCAKDHRSWENFYPPGTTVEDGIPVHRFSVDERDLEIFIRSEHAIRDARPLSINEQLAWLENGVNSKALYQEIARRGEEFDYFIFAPYLFPTSFWGSLINPEKSVLLPCLHNEAYAFMEVFRPMFKRAAKIIYNAKAEKKLAEEIFGESLASRGAVVGMGFSEQSAGEAQSVPLELGQYVLYSGRKEQGKNLDKLIQWFCFARAKLPQLKLILIGSGEINFLDKLPDGVQDLGFVTEADKLKLMGSALCLAQPSVNESFSIVIMEAWQQGIPVLVHADCSVTKEHVLDSSGGLYVKDEREFYAALCYLLENPHERSALAEAGREFVRRQYSWPAVIGRLAAALQEQTNQIKEQTS